MDNEKEMVWTEEMGFMPPVTKTEGRIICRGECQLTEHKEEIERLREALKEIADAKISGVIDDGYNVRDWLIKHHVILVNKARAALKEGE